jgi:hypothetical protein
MYTALHQILFEISDDKETLEWGTSIIDENEHAICVALEVDIAG